MIGPDVRNDIFQLHQAGMSLREISRRLHVSRNAVRHILRNQEKSSQPHRRDKKQVDIELLERLYAECDGWIQRIHEKLVEEEGIQIGYSTLTRLLRELGLSGNHSARCDRVPDEPGAEMQHDTTVYRVKIGDRPTRLIASLVYLRYSKRRYLKFYRAFNRFAMKCFLHEALMYWGYAARRCVIDNTNLARLRGVGSRAVMVPEMQAFSQRYGFQFVCHALDHPNRKAGNERAFWGVETGFLPGRTFENLEDLNQQARQWATERMEQRPLTKARLIPAKLFEHERLFLHALPPHLPAPYQEHRRGTDQYGYVAFAANYYWVPGTRRQEVKLLEYADRVKIFTAGQLDCLAEYCLPPDGVRAQYYSPPGQPRLLRDLPRIDPGTVSVVGRSQRTESVQAVLVLRLPGDRRSGLCGSRTGAGRTVLYLDAQAAQAEDDDPHVQSGLRRMGIVSEQSATDGRLDRSPDLQQSCDQHEELQKLAGSLGRVGREGRIAPVPSP